MILLAPMIFGKCAYASEVGNAEIVEEYVRKYGEILESGLSALNAPEAEKVIPGFSVSSILSELVKGENIFSVRGILEHVIRLLTEEVRNTLKLMLLFLTVSIISTYITNMQTSFGRGGVSDAAFFVCYAVTAGIAAGAFTEVAGCAERALENITLFMRVLIPLTLAGTAASGAPITATAFETAIIAVTEITRWAIVSVFVPLLMTAAGVGMVNNLSDRLKADKTAELLNKSVKWGLGIMLTLFVGVIGLQGIAAGNIDGLTVKVTKFAASNLIPVVGGILAETVETVMNCSAVIRNAAGIAGIIVIAVVTATPLLKIAACLLIFRISAAVIQPIADKRTVKCISEMADGIACIFSMLAAVSVMFIIILTLMINMGTSASAFAGR